MASLSLGQRVRGFCNVRVSALLKGRSDVSTQFHIHWGLKPDQSVCVLRTRRLWPAECDVAALQQHKSVNHVTVDSFPGSKHLRHAHQITVQLSSGLFCFLRELHQFLLRLCESGPAELPAAHRCWAQVSARNCFHLAELHWKNS